MKKKPIGKVDIVLGLQWGDEGKGKIVDVLAPNYDIIARFQGGPNAGHTLVIDGTKYVLHQIPSGLFHPHTTCVIGNGVIINPVIFQKELKTLEAAGIDYKDRLLLSDRAHFILPTHSLLDKHYEASKAKAKELGSGSGKIGSTLRGISPAYTDKVLRNGLRLGDVFSDNFEEMFNNLIESHLALLGDSVDKNELEKLCSEFMDAANELKKLQIIQTEIYLNKALKEGKNVLAEGAQGSLLDVDFGDYPFVTSSNTISGSACIGLGIPPSSINKVFGVFKAYATRVGEGPFPTELFGEDGDNLRAAGNEFGATTGRPRRCGWIDLPLLRYTCTLSGVTDLVMTKADVLSGFSDVKMATAHMVNDNVSEWPCRENGQPIYETFSGWDVDQGASSCPTELSEFISHIESELEIPVKWVSLGPDRVQMVER